jgi:ABC-2 type transport system permease protein
MKLHRITALLMRHIYLYQRSIPRLMDLFFWPILEILVWGFLSIYLESLNLTGINIVSLLLGAVIFWDLLSQSQRAVSFAFMEEVWEKNFLNIFVTPLKTSEFLTSTFLLGVVRILLVGIILGVTSLLFYDYNILQFGLYSIPIIMNLLLFGWALGLFSTALIFRFGNSAQMLAYAFIFLIQPFSAVFYPITALPETIRWISYMLPSSYVFEGLRAIIHGGAFPLMEFTIALGLNVFYILLIGYFFYRAFYWVRVNGKLLKID